MTLPRVQFTVRRMILAVAIVAIATSTSVQGYNRRICLKNAEICEDMASKIERQIAAPGSSTGFTPRERPLPFSASRSPGSVGMGRIGG